MLGYIKHIYWTRREKSAGAGPVLVYTGPSHHQGNASSKVQCWSSGWEEIYLGWEGKVEEGTRAGGKGGTFRFLIHWSLSFLSGWKAQQSSFNLCWQNNWRRLEEGYCGPVPLLREGDKRDLCQSQQGSWIKKTPFWHHCTQRWCHHKDWATWPCMKLVGREMERWPWMDQEKEGGCHCPGSLPTCYGGDQNERPSHHLLGQDGKGSKRALSMRHLFPISQQ